MKDQGLKKSDCVPMIKAVIFDWGGVLIDHPAQGILSYCAKALGVSYEEFRGVYKKFVVEFQKGKIPEDVLWNNVCNELGVKKPNTPSLWKDAFKHAYSPRREIFALASTIHSEGYKVGFLSNTEIPAMEFLKEQNYDMFDATVFSCVEGVMKPEKRIYEIMLEKLDVEPNEAVFIDDRQDFIDGAKKAGFSTILFKDFNQLKKELTSFSIRVE